eukprot:scaffold154693_cov31-Tisochrysis_lutea.AAC.1
MASGDVRRRRSHYEDLIEPSTVGMDAVSRGLCLTSGCASLLMRMSIGTAGGVPDAVVELLCGVDQLDPPHPRREREMLTTSFPAVPGVSRGFASPNHRSTVDLPHSSPMRPFARRRR